MNEYTINGRVLEWCTYINYDTYQAFMERRWREPQTTNE